MSTINTNYKITITGDQKYLEITRELIHFIFTHQGLDIMDTTKIEMAVSEACHNALLYGSKSGDRATFNLELFISAEVIKAVITDCGEAIDFDNIEPFCINQDFLAYRNGGLGIPLIKALMDEVYYERKPNNTNELTLIKHLKLENNKGRRKTK